MTSHGSLLRALWVAFEIATVVGGMVEQGILRMSGIIVDVVQPPELRRPPRAQLA